MDYRVIRSKRKSYSLQIKDGELIVKTPLHTSDKEIEELIKKHEKWIKTALAKEKSLSEKAENQGSLTDSDIKMLAEKAKTVIPPKVAFYANKIGVKYGRITIRNQTTRWGSCSSKGNLNFNCLLMLCPDQVIDSVVVHELCHIKEMNHSEKFYAEVRRAFPEYDKWNRWLKDNGGVLIKRMNGN